MKTKTKITLIDFIAKLVSIIIGVSIAILCIHGLAYVFTKISSYIQTGVEFWNIVILSILVAFSVNFGIEIFKQVADQSIEWFIGKVVIWEQKIINKNRTVGTH